MKGDFSRWDPVSGKNLGAVLHQQGRVLLDRDWNDQARLTMDWQDEAARQIIGPGVAAVSTTNRNAFLVEAARVNTDGEVVIEVRPGSVWADGLVVELVGDPAGTVGRTASYLLTPVQDPSGTVASIADGVRDVVVLEVWREALNAFQLAEELIEPALGGPDTTERALTSMRFRLFRLADGEDCKTIREALRDDASKGRLTVSLQPSAAIGADCPVVDGGGYVGFEHHLYRIEIADTDGPARFKWSTFNGGLVGRGTWDRSDPGNLKIDIDANDQAIKTSGITDFYMETVELDPDEGRWRVTYGADVTLNGGTLEVATARLDAPLTPLPNRVFFRLWDGSRLLTDFPAPPAGVDATALRDGIRLAFDATGSYRPGDFWTFEVRAGEIANPDTLVDDEAPHGVRYHRVPLAELEWTADTVGGITFADEEIEDCREIFSPLTSPDGCCTYSVGDGVRSHGDFDSIEEALRHLPAMGGKICVLPGIHEANVEIRGRSSLGCVKTIEISGCGSRTVVLPRQANVGEAIFTIEDAQTITIANLTLVAPSGTAIVVHDSVGAARPSHEISIHHNDIVACLHGIDVRVDNGSAGNNDIVVADNRVAMLDKAGGLAGIFALADDVLIERNRVVVVPAPSDDAGDPRNPNDRTAPPFDPCADPRIIYGKAFRLYEFVCDTMYYLMAADGRYLNSINRIEYVAQGGIQIGGGSERVRVRDNLVIGGYGHGVVLGHIPKVPDTQFKKRISYGEGTSAKEVDFLKKHTIPIVYDIEIERNSIHNMGLSGIGVFAFMHLETFRMIMRVEDLFVHRNRITNCAQQVPDLDNMTNEAGFGGISLGDANHAIITENLIENNGVTRQEPICGIFILAGERIDISNNQILNNGPQPLRDVGNPELAQNAQRGSRGGIVIRMSFAAVGRSLAPAFASESPSRVTDVKLPVREGIPAVKVHDNIVVQPLGRALFLMAMGPVSVVGNHFTSQGIAAHDVAGTIAGAILILNLGISKDLMAFMLLNSYRSLARPNAGEPQAESITTDPNASLRQIERIAYLPNGAVLYSNNTTTLDLRDREINFAFSAQVIVSLDDVGYTSNYSECTSLIDIVLTNAFLAGVTVRTNDNRFQEGFTVAFLSLLSIATMNTATSNQSTHCLLALGARRVEALNLVVMGADCSGELQFLADHLGYAQQTTFVTTTNLEGSNG